MRRSLKLTPYPEITLWWCGKTIRYWQVHAVDQRLQDGFANTTWFMQDRIRGKR
jgi:hypothetical protein